MFICSICKTGFGRLTSLKNYKKTHKNYYQVEDETDTSFKDENMDSDISEGSE
ncbi:2944_t:CDS:1, partial [Gigaspora margarita]